MNLVDFWKFINKLKGKWGVVLRIALGIFILSLATIYLYYRFPTIIRSGERQIDTAVIAISAIIILLPFLSEIEIFGVKFKKEIEEIKKETDEKLKVIEQRLLIIQSQSVNLDQKIQIVSPKSLEESKAAVQDTISSPKTDKNSVFKIPQEISELIATNYNIQRTLSSLVNKIDKSNPNSFANIGERLRYANPYNGKFDSIKYIEEKINVDNNIMKAIRQVLYICQQAEKGEEVADIQYEFVKETAPSLISYLQEINLP